MLLLFQRMNTFQMSGESGYPEMAEIQKIMQLRQQYPVIKEAENLTPLSNHLLGFQEQQPQSLSWLLLPKGQRRFITKQAEIIQYREESKRGKARRELGQDNTERV